MLPAKVQSYNKNIITELNSGRIMIVDPRTNKQCFAQCLAINRVFKDDSIKHNFGYNIKQVQAKIAEQYRIKEGVDIGNIP